MSRILLVDDDVQASAAIAATLQVLGHDVTTAVSENEGQDRIDRWHPDIALVDMMLQGSSGLDLIAWIAAGRRRVYTCLATGMGDFRLLKRAIQTGAWSLMCKPLALPDLMETLAKGERLLRATIGVDCVESGASQDTLHLTSADCSDTDKIVATTSAFARECGADLDTATRLTPIVVFELLQNARRYGKDSFEVICRSAGTDLELSIADHGPGFGWQRELARRRSNWEGSRASGLQLTTAVADLCYENDGRTACIRVPLRSQLKTTAAITVAAL